MGCDVVWQWRVAMSKAQFGYVGVDQVTPMYSSPVALQEYFGMNLEADERKQSVVFLSCYIPSDYLKHRVARHGNKPLKRGHEVELSESSA